MTSGVGHKGILHGTSDGTYTVGDERAWLSIRCGHCGSDTSAAVLCFTADPGSRPVERWMRCTQCGHGTIRMYDGDQYPAPALGRAVEGLPGDVAHSFDEARRCTTVSAWTACEMVCRKILMHIAVDKGAAEGETFAKYIDHLSSSGYLTPPMKPWVDMIRTRGNAATHELPSTTQDQAEAVVIFTEHLLRNVYEMEHLSGRFTAAPTVAPTDESTGGL
jgi:hypothetical protein